MAVHQVDLGVADRPANGHGGSQVPVRSLVASDIRGNFGRAIDIQQGCFWERLAKAFGQISRQNLAAARPSLSSGTRRSRFGE